MSFRGALFLFAFSGCIRALPLLFVIFWYALRRLPPPPLATARSVAIWLKPFWLKRFWLQLRSPGAEIASHGSLQAAVAIHL